MDGECSHRAEGGLRSRWRWVSFRQSALLSGVPDFATRVAGSLEEQRDLCGDSPVPGGGSRE